MYLPVFSSFVFFLVFAGYIAGEGEDLRLPAAEQEAVYLALESVNPDVPWRTIYSGDLCLSGPHGIVCDLFPANSGKLFSHIAELNFGFVSDYTSNPSCSPNATIPPSLPSFPFLRKLFFYNCFISSKTSINGLFSNLSSSLEEIVFISNTALSGHLDGTIGNFRNLRRLILDGNGISGQIPTEIGKLQTLNQLDLSANRIHGSIPRSIGNATGLRILDLSGNRISGPIPSEIGQLGKLVKIDLNSNRLTGPIPAELCRLKLLEFFDLSRNRLTGGVPAEIGEMVGLKEIYLSGNSHLGGHIPEIWGNLRGVFGVGLSGIGLVGNIPPSMGVFLERLSYLGLDRNFLEGQVPEQFSLLEGSASEINVENNRLEGRIPFSAGFVVKMGGNLKVGGNPKLCLDEELVGHVRGRTRGSVGTLNKCNNTDIPHPVLFSSGVSLSRVKFWGFCLIFLLVLFLC